MRTPPTRRLRRPPTTLLLAVVAVLTAGCQVRVDTGIDLREDDTAVVDLTVGIRFEEGLPPEVTAGASEGGISPEDAQEGIEESAASCGFDPALASVEPYEPDDGFTGVSILLDGIPIEAVNCFFGEESDNQFFTDFDISREGEEFVFTATVADLAAELQESLGTGLGAGPGGQKRQVAQAETELEGFDEAFGEGFEDALANPEELFDITIRVTFPGELGENNATRVEGTTAIWEVGAGAMTLMARGQASEGGGGLGDILPWVLIGLVVLLVLGLLIFLLARRGRGGQSHGPGYTVPGAHGTSPMPGQPGVAPPPVQPGVPPTPGYPSGPGAPPAGVPQWGESPGGPPSAPSQPEQWGQQPAPPAQPQQPAPRPPEESDGGFNPDATRTFRPEDLLPPQDPPPDQGR